MMGLLCSSSSLQMALTITVCFMVVLTTCSTRECKLLLGEKTKNRSVTLWDIDIRMCHVECVEDAFILEWCHQLRDSVQTVTPGGTSTENHHVLKPSCGSKVCNTTSVCLETGCSKECVQAPSFCDLHVASKTGDLAKVKVILSKARVDMNCKEWNSRTPVKLAAREGHRDVVRLLISNGADVSDVDDFGINLLHAACLGGDVTLVKYVLSLGKHGINEKVLCGGTPVMLAAENGHKDVVELLVGEGANVLLQDNKGFNLLHHACRGGHVDVVEYVLLENLVDINSRGWKGMTPVMVAAWRGFREVVELLVSKGAKMSLVDKKGNNILHTACLGGHVKMVKYVLSQNMADINSRGFKSRTPVLLAAQRGYREVVELLVTEGADVSLVDEKGNNILHTACRTGHVEVVKYVLSQNLVDINSRTKKGKTPVMVAAMMGRNEVVELLVSKGADRPHEKNK